MSDPLSITTGVVALLQVTWTVANELKKFHNGASIVDKTISDLQGDVRSLTGVLESMRDTFEAITAEHGTGDIASLWTNVAQSIEVGKEVLMQLHGQIQDINKDTNFLDEHRKQLRLNRAESKIAGFRIRIQSYRTADQVLPNLNELHNDVRRIALDLNQQIESLRSMVRSQQDEAQLVAISNLRDCVRSAASTISSATTMIVSRKGDDDLIPSGSDFGDCFPVQHNLPMRRWIESRTVYEYNEAASLAPPRSVADLPRLDGSETDSGSDSDIDLDHELTRVLLESGKQKLAGGDTTSAEKLLRNCMGRCESTNTRTSDRRTTLLLEVVETLHGIHFAQQKWHEAREMLLQKITVKERSDGSRYPDYLQDITSLAKVMLFKGDVVEAQLHARRALKGYRRLQRNDDIHASLSLLIDICKAQGNENDQEAYTVMLAGLQRSVESEKSLVGSNDLLFGTSSETLLNESQLAGESIANEATLEVAEVTRGSPGFYSQPEPTSPSQKPEQPNNASVQVVESSSKDVTRQQQSGDEPSPAALQTKTDNQPSQGRTATESHDYSGEDWRGYDRSYDCFADYDEPPPPPPSKALWEKQPIFATQSPQAGYDVDGDNRLAHCQHTGDRKSIDEKCRSESSNTCATTEQAQETETQIESYTRRGYPRDQVLQYIAALGRKRSRSMLDPKQ